MSSEREWLRGLPKAELHVHLEGTITQEAYQRIARRNKAPLPDDVASAFACSDFASFLQAFLSVVRALREPEDFAEIASEYLNTSAGEGVLHVEFFFSPATIRYFRKTADLPGIVQAIDAAARAEQKRTGVSSSIIFDLVRNLGEEAALADIDLAQQCARWGVVGIGLGGDERNFPARDFCKPFARAKRLGLRRTVHAGEAAGPESVRDAIELLDAERIGHGVAATQDAALMDLMAARRVGVDSCLTGNVVTGAVAAVAEHSLAVFLRRGIEVTLSSDDPAFFGASLLDEYEQATRLGLTRTDIVTLARNSFNRAFVSKDVKRSWLDKLSAYTTTI